MKKKWELTSWGDIKVGDHVQLLNYQYQKLSNVFGEVTSSYTRVEGSPYFGLIGVNAALYHEDDGWIVAVRTGQTDANV